MRKIWLQRNIPVLVNEVSDFTVALFIEVASVNGNSHPLRKLGNDLRNLAATILGIAIEALNFVNFVPVEADNLGFRLFFKLGGVSFNGFCA